MPLPVLTWEYYLFVYHRMETMGTCTWIHQRNYVKKGTLSKLIDSELYVLAWHEREPEGLLGLTGPIIVSFLPRVCVDMRCMGCALFSNAINSPIKLIDNYLLKKKAFESSFNGLQKISIPTKKKTHTHTEHFHTKFPPCLVYQLSKTNIDL